jgi:choice-of-anchor B domain-containing protein
MLVRTVRFSLLGFLIALGAAAPAAAMHPPSQHDSQRMSIEDALMGTNLSQQIAQSQSFECEDGMAGPFPCRNVDLAGFAPLPMLGGATGNDIWGWTDPATGKEYAIMGTSHSIGFVDVTDPEDPVVIGSLPTRGIPDFVLWRGMKTDGHWLFVVSEITDSGLQVFDLRKLRDANGEPPTVFQDDAYWMAEDDTGEMLSSTHDIWVNEASDTAYLVGTNACDHNGENGGMFMVDVSNPTEPEFAGCTRVDSFFDQGGEDEQSNNYTHGVECVIYGGPDTEHQGKEICFASNENTLVIFDVTDKANPVVLSDTTYPNAAYTHQGSLTEDERFFIFGDELDEQQEGVPTTTYIMDVTDLDNPPTPMPYEHPTVGIDHNMYVHGNHVFQSNYTAGLTILGFDNAMLSNGDLREDAFFDVVPGVDVAEFAGTWGVFRFEKSGTVVMSSIDNQANGLFVLRPTLGGGGQAAGPSGAAVGKECKKAKRKKGNGKGKKAARKKGKRKKAKCKKRKKGKKRKKRA